MIIVEGLDNTGKTTLIQKLGVSFPDLERIPSIGNKHNLDSIRAQAWDAITVDKTNPLRLWDRSRFISEYIYNPILKGREYAFDTDEWFMMLAAFFRRPQLIIFCTRRVVQIQESFDEREQLGGVAENIIPLDNAYHTFMKFFDFMFKYVVPDTQSQVLFYNFDIDPNGHILHGIEAEVKRYIDRFSVPGRETAKV